jgi:uncharacterized protein with GYD domain
MPLYLSRATYAPETWANLIERPEDRREAARREVEAVGGTLHGMWYAFGAHDLYVLREVPDDVAMAAIAIKVAASGAVRGLDTIPLLTVEDTLVALDRARDVTYRPPGS